MGAPRVVQLKEYVKGMYSQRWWSYLDGRTRNNNEAWQCPRCKGYMPFYVDECYFCGD